MLKLVILLLVCSCGVVLSAITLNGVKCGQKICKRGEYCNPFHNSCDSCAPICDPASHNYDAEPCTQHCQDYIHDSRYVLKDDSSGNANLRETVQRLSRMVTVVLTLVCFILVALATVLIIQIYRWKKKKNITITSIKERFFSKKSDSSPPNKNSNQGSEKPDLRLEIPTPGTQSDHSPVTVTTSISRRPAEDSTLDYAYDNPAMATGPGTRSAENTF